MLQQTLSRELHSLPLILLRVLPFHNTSLLIIIILYLGLASQPLTVVFWNVQARIENSSGCSSRRLYIFILIAGCRLAQYYLRSQYLQIISKRLQIISARSVRRIIVATAFAETSHITARQGVHIVCWSYMRADVTRIMVAEIHMVRMWRGDRIISKIAFARNVISATSEFSWLYKLLLYGFAYVDARYTNSLQYARWSTIFQPARWSTVGSMRDYRKFHKTVSQLAACMSITCARLYEWRSKIV